MKLGITSQKLLVLLLGGVALGFSLSPGRQRRIIKSVASEWKTLDRRELSRSIQRLYQSKLISYKEEADESISVVLNRRGEKVALRYKVEELVIPKPQVWDKRWRIILFDIPENRKKLRDTLRRKLNTMGLLELQKSVMVHPFECRNEIDFIIELYDARKFVRFVEATHIDNELHLKKRFDLK